MAPLHRLHSFETFSETSLLLLAPFLEETERKFFDRRPETDPTLCADSHMEDQDQDQAMPQVLGLPTIAEILGVSQCFQVAKIDLNDWYPRYLNCLRHFLDRAQHALFVQSMAAFLNIRLPCQKPSDPVLRFSDQRANMLNSTDYGTPFPPPHPSTFVSLIPYIRRLIVTGTDTPSVLFEFFGEDWLAGVGPIQRQERINYLFTAKSEGWLPTKREYDILPDEQVPFLKPLREPLEEEIREAETRWSEWLAMEDWMIGPRNPF